MSVERFEVGKTYRSDSGSTFACEWAADEQSAPLSVDVAGIHNGRQGSCGLWRAEWTEVQSDVVRWVGVRSENLHLTEAECRQDYAGCDAYIEWNVTQGTATVHPGVKP